jgi:hypothetical protein
VNRAAAATVVETVGREHPVADALLTFKLRHYQPRAAAMPGRERVLAAPGSIKDAIIRWLDEQL